MVSRQLVGKTLICVMLIPTILIGCADKSAKIAASYVSPLKYRSYSCAQLTEEYARVLEEAGITNKAQDDVAANDAWAMGIGLVVFWPALFFIDNDDQREQVARLKGELKAIDQAAIRKDCFDLRKSMDADKKRMKEAAERANKDSAN